MDYAQSRLQARFGARPDESLWRALEAAPEPSAALELARASALNRWVAGIAPNAGRHAIEIAVRARWRECVSEIARWMPQDWQPALRWTRVLIDLPALAHLAGGAAALPWMLDDPVLRAYAGCDPRTRENLLLAAGCAFLFPPRGKAPEPDPMRISRAWLDEWRRRWPRWGDTASLEDLAELLEAATKRPAAIGRPELMHQLRRLFRRAVLRPAAAFIYLACAALDIERLRAGLLRHDLAREGIVSS